ncbi:protein Mpv17-like isoform X2 [Branchiostoma floridae]|uniref:Protein Mpv17-like isoform X2 n=1 Tax=Branchiostoma floridae TaxID=7739 RepID=A0A9J7LIM3_BRAFL|nr:protein Mpv17-like isoform X2 [Branchiostoma floridae]
MFLDQALMAPFFLGAFYPVVGLSRWDSWEDIKQLVKKLWPAVQLANFYFVPLNLRLLVMNCSRVEHILILESKQSNRRLIHLLVSSLTRKLKKGCEDGTTDM